MGNSGLRKLLFPGDLSESKYNDIFAIPVMDLDRNELPLERFKNDAPCLIVNVGSQSPEVLRNIQDLKDLGQRYNGRLNILAFPSNQFGNEPQTFEEIKRIYRDEFQITFPIFAKVEVNGRFTSEVYRFLKRNSVLYNYPLLSASAINSDFCKFLVSKEGKVLRYFDRTATHETLLKELEAVVPKLAEKID